MILAVSHSADDHATAVLDILERRRQPALLLDTAKFPAEATLSQHYGPGGLNFELCVDGGSYDLSQCHAGWWRRPQPFTLHEGIDPDVASFTYTECHEAVAGLWHALGLRWVNSPDQDEVAHHKPYQLAVATEVGLTIPRTLITNCPVDARAFVDELGPERTVYKTFLASEQHWRETRLIRPEELDLLQSVRIAPVIFQEFVPAQADLRVTVVGDRMFPAAIQAAPDGYDVDYRMNLAGATFAAAELPASLVDGLRALMKRLGIVYGAIDLRLTPEGEYIFLEVNPAGEWLFVQERTGQPISEAMADLLTDLDTLPQ